MAKVRRKRILPLTLLRTYATQFLGATSLVALARRRHGNLKRDVAREQVGAIVRAERDDGVVERVDFSAVPWATR